MRTSFPKLGGLGFFLAVLQICCAAAAGATTAPSTAPTTTPATPPIPIADVAPHPVNFAEEVLPIFRASCLACHNAKESKGNLILETPKAIRTGGDSGPAALPADPLNSPLLLSSSHQEKPYMPPRSNRVGADPLTPAQLGLLKLWVSQGAKGDETIRAATITWHPLPPGINAIFAVALSPDGQYAACGRANQVFIYDVPSKRLVTRLTDPSLGDASRPPAPTTAASGATTAPAALPGLAHHDIVQSLAFSPDGRTLASGGYREVKLWRRPEPAPRLTLVDAATQGATAATASADGSVIAMAGNDHVVRIFDASAGKLLATLPGHQAAITSLVFTLDHSRLYSGSIDKTVRAWNAQSGAEIGHWDLPSDVLALARLDNGQLAAGCADKLIRLWDEAALPAAATQPASQPAAPAFVFKTLTGHNGPVTALASAASAPTLLLSGSQDGSVRLWDTTTAKAGRVLDLGGPVASVAMRADTKRLAAAGPGRIAKVWNNADGTEVATARVDRAALAILDTAARRVSYATGELAHWKTQLEDATRRKTSEADAIARVARLKVAADKKLADVTVKEKAKTEASAAADKALADATAAEAVAKAAKEASEKATAAGTGSPESRAAAERALAEAINRRREKEDRARQASAEFADVDGSFQRAQQSVMSLEKTGESAKANLAKAEADVVAATAGQKEGTTALATAEAEATAARKQLAEAGTPMTSVAFSRDGGTLFTACADGAVRTWSADTGAPADLLPPAAAGGGAASAVAVVDSGSLLTCYATGAARVWNLGEDWKLLRVIGNGEPTSPLAGRVLTLAFSPDGSLLATGGGVPSRSGELKLWNPADGALVREIVDAHSDTVFGVNFSRDGRLLASCAADKFMKVFTPADGKLFHSFEGHANHVLGVGFRYDGRMLVTGGADNLLKYWDVEGEEKKLQIPAFPQEVTSVNYLGFTETALVTTGSGVVRIMREGGGVRDLDARGAYVLCGAATPDGNTVAAGSQDGTLRVCDARDGKALATFTTGGEAQ